SWEAAVKASRSPSPTIGRSITSSKAKCIAPRTPKLRPPRAPSGGRWTMRSSKYVALAFGAVLSFAASAAFADGVAIAPSALADADRQALSSQIAQYRTQHPQAFQALRELKGIRPEFYNRFRNPRPEVGRELRGFGAVVLLPMLDA